MLFREGELMLLHLNKLYIFFEITLDIEAVHDVLLLLQKRLLCFIMLLLGLCFLPDTFLDLRFYTISALHNYTQKKFYFDCTIMITHNSFCITLLLKRVFTKWVALRVFHKGRSSSQNTHACISALHSCGCVMPHFKVNALETSS